MKNESYSSRRQPFQTHPTSPMLWFLLMIVSYFFIFGDSESDGLPQQSMFTPSRELTNEVKKKRLLEKYGNDQQKEQILKKYGPSDKPSFTPLQQPSHRPE